jgi:hypothetical protein
MCMLTSYDTLYRVYRMQNQYAQDIFGSTCMYSPDVSHLKSQPSHLRVLVNTTVLAGMFSPIENVSVANKHLIKPSCMLH